MGMKERRLERGLTQKEVAGLFGLKRNTYQNYERRKIEPTLDTASKLAVFFKCTIGELFDLQEGDDRPEGAGEDMLLTNYRSLDETGQRKLLEFSGDLVSSGNYKPE